MSATATKTATPHPKRLRVISPEAAALRATVKAAYRAGLSICPPRMDGTKAPAGKWKTFQATRATPKQLLRNWYGPGSGCTGVGLICGKVSGNLVVLEFDDMGAYRRFVAAARALGLGALVDRIESGFCDESPGGGIHWYFYCEVVAGNTKLAERIAPPAPVAEGETPKPEMRKPLIETREEGGFIVIAPSYGAVHPSGKPYKLLAGSVSTIATITPEERAELWSLARTFDEVPPEKRTEPGQPSNGSRPAAGPNGPGKASGSTRSTRKEGTPLRPGDDFNSRATWDEVMVGWTKLHTSGETTYWRRPGKEDRGWSATTNHLGSDVLIVFSSSTEFETTPTTYTKFGAYAVLQHQGDLGRAAKSLAEQGYGEPIRRREDKPRLKIVRPSDGERNGSGDGGNGGGGAGGRKPTFAPGANEKPDDPHRLARIYLLKKYDHSDGLALRYYQGQYYRWRLSYDPVPDKEVNAEITGVVKEEFDAACRVNTEAYEQNGSEGEKPASQKVTKSLIGNVSQAVASLSLLAGDTRQPAWLCPDPPFPAEDVLPTRNYLVHLPSFVGGRGPDALRPATPLYFSPYSLDYDFNPSPPRPDLWLRFLGEIFPDDPDSISALQEWMGYLLTGDTRHHKIMMLIGEKRSGKGTIARIATALLGQSNVANPTLAGLTTNFGLSPLIGKLAAIVGDVRLSGRTDVAQVTERLLSISGEDNQTIDRKHLPAWNGRLLVRFMLLSNMLPKLDDASGALASRMIFLNFTRSFYGREDMTLYDRLTPELPSILLWAIAGWDRLRRRGYFVQPESGKSLAEEMESISSPIGQFVKDRCRLDPHEKIITGDLFKAWKVWCEAAGKEWSGDIQTFGRLLRSVKSSIKTKPCRQRDDMGISTVTRAFVGITLDPDKAHVPALSDVIEEGDGP